MKADKQSIQEDLLGAASNLAEAWSANVVLKSASTVISTRLEDQGGHLWISPTGNSGMGTAGSGDVLSGIISGLAAQLYKLKRPVAWSGPLGVYLHGLAGDIAASRHSEYAMRASLITEHLGDAFLRLEHSP